MSVLVLAGFAAWLAVAAVACYAVYRYQDGLGRAVVLPRTPQVAIILPIRGTPPPGLWPALVAQDYDRWRIVFAVESTADPAYGALSALIGERGEIVVAGAALDTGQKVHNQLAALKRLCAGDEVVVFADADILPRPDWLSRLVMPLLEPGIDAVSGYRWLVPADGRLATHFVCLANAQIATVPRLRRVNLAWGGSMALRRETLEALDLERWWRGSLDDDIQLTRALWARGLKVNAPRELLVPSPAAYGWREAIAFGRRQYLLVRTYAPAHWLGAALATALPLAGWAIALPLALGGDPLALGVILAANLLDQCRASFRGRVPQKLWGEMWPARLRRLDRWATPAWLLFHACLIWSTLAGGKIRWAGRTYQLDGPQRVTILAAPPARDRDA
jgi:hypothetical protein